MESKLDLEKLQQMLDDALEHETKESLEEWLKQQGYLDNQVACAKMSQFWIPMLSEEKELNNLKFKKYAMRIFGKNLDN